MGKINTHSREYVREEAKMPPYWGLFIINSKPGTWAGSPESDAEYDAVVDPIIDRMHNANTADELHEAYIDYSHFKVHGNDRSKCPVGVCTGILQNENQNKRFGFTEDYIMETYFNEDGSVKSLEQLAKQGRPSTVKHDPKVDKQLETIRLYMGVFDDAMEKFKNGTVANKNDTAIDLKCTVRLINSAVAEIEPTVLTDEQLTELNDIESKMKDVSILITEMKLDNSSNIIEANSEEVKKAKPAKVNKHDDSEVKETENIQDDERPFRFK